ncbi:MAG: hypothetical protein OSB26_09270 [Woeseiaceae bacterium]|nr:hypothetical protein [Woeseiaceae bacterium]
MNKVVLALVTAVLLAIAAAKFAYHVKVDYGIESGNEPWANSKMEFVSWNNQKWTTWIRDDLFEQTPLNTSNWSRHSNATIAFTNWDGEPWQARVDGDAFLLAHRGDWEGPLERSEGIRYQDWSGDKQIRTIANIRR